MGLADDLSALTVTDNGWPTQLGLHVRSGSRQGSFHGVGSGLFQPGRPKPAATRRQILAQLSAGAAVYGLAWPFAATSALAHGSKPHAKEGPALKEQKDWGIAGEARDVKRRIDVGMTDAMRFKPDRIDIPLGDTVRFVVRNQGKVMHEFVIGTQAENARHAQWMLKFPNMEHDEPYMAHVPPGKTGEIIWHFNRVGEFEFACLIAGHYQAGMVGTIRVVAAGKG